MSTIADLVFVGKCSETVTETRHGGAVLNDDNLSGGCRFVINLRYATKRTYEVLFFESSFRRGGVRRDVESLGAEMSRGSRTSLFLD